MKPASILFVNPTGQLGGAEISLLDLATHLDRSRFEPVLVSLGQGPFIAAAKRQRLIVHDIQLPRAFSRLSLKGRRSGAFGLAAAGAATVPSIWGLRKLARRHQAAIIHTNGNKAHLLGSFAITNGLRLVWHVRDFLRDGLPERFLVRLANRNAGSVIANSAAVAAHLIQRGVDPRLVKALPNGIDCSRFTPDGDVAPLRGDFNWASDTKLIGIVGMLTPWKGQDVLLRAFSEIVHRHPDSRCLIIGDEIYETAGHGGFADRLKDLARSSGIEGRVGFTGYRDDIPAVLRALDVVVHASVEPEPFGRVVAEAMACGRAVVATDGGGVPEVTGPSGEAAMLAAKGDVRSMTLAIESLLTQPARAARMGRAARDRIVSRFPLAAHLDGVQDLYERLLAAPASHVSVWRTEPHAS